MRCWICGEEIDANSKYCRKCGSYLEDSQKKMNEYTVKQMQEIWPDVNNELKRKQFKKIEIGYSSLEDMNFDKELKIEGDSLKINLKKENVVKLLCAYIINELDSFHNMCAGLAKDIHNDRKAMVESGKEKYEKALKTKDKDIKKAELQAASDDVINGLNALKMEMDDSLDLLQKIPQNLIKKLFCGISMQDAVQKLSNIQEAFPYYLLGVRLCIEIDRERDEMERILVTLKTAQEYIHKFSQHKGYVRLLEIDDENRDRWEESTERFKIALELLAKKIESDEMCIELGGDYHE